MTIKHLSPHASGGYYFFAGFVDGDDIDRDGVTTLLKKYSEDFDVYNFYIDHYIDYTFVDISKSMNTRVCYIALDGPRSVECKMKYPNGYS